jgi:Tfp pilus assembly protein PilF
MTDILRLESEIAQAVASEIQVKLTPAEQQRIDETPAIDPRASEAFLLGRHYFNMWTVDSERQAVDSFQKAVSIEPNYADAWAGLADAWTLRAIVGDVSPHEAEKPTREYAQKALDIDPQNSAAHVSMCFIHTNYGFDWAAGENSCKKGIELDPNNAKAHFAYAYLLARLERWDEMSEQMDHATRLDPGEPWWSSVYGNFLTQARRFDEAERSLQRAIRVDPNYRPTYVNLSRLRVEQGRYDEALAMLQQHGFTGHMGAARIYARKGDLKKARELIATADDKDSHEAVLVYAALGDRDRAFELINASLDRGDGFMFGYGCWPDLDPLKSDSRWYALMRRMNLPG